MTVMCLRQGECAFPDLQFAVDQLLNDIKNTDNKAFRISSSVEDNAYFMSFVLQLRTTSPFMLLQRDIVRGTGYDDTLTNFARLHDDIAEEGIDHMQSILREQR